MEWFIGVGFATVNVVLMIFTAVLVKCFEAYHDLPSNLGMIRGVMQVFLFAVAVAQGNQFILPTTSRDKLLVITRGFFTGFLFFTNIAALRFLPVGDVFTIFSARSVFSVILPSLIISTFKHGKSMDVAKCCLVLVSSLGFYLFISHKIWKQEPLNPVEEREALCLHLSWVAIIEKTSEASTLLLGMVMAFINLLLEVPIQYLTKRCEAISPSVQSFWSGVGGFFVGVVASFFDSKTSIFSGHYSYYEFTAMVVISSSFIMITVLQSQSIKFIPLPAVNIIRLSIIPVAYVLCQTQRMPDFYSVIGIMFILASSVVADWLLYTEEREGYRELLTSPLNQGC